MTNSASETEQPFDEWLTRLGNTAMELWTRLDMRRCYREMRRLQAEVEQLRADRDRYRELLEAAEEARVDAFAGPATKVR